MTDKIKRGSEETSCPLCGGPEHEIRHAFPEKKILVVQCSGCGIVFTLSSVAAIPVREDIYHEAYFEGCDRPGGRPSFEERESVFRLKWDRELFPKIERLLPEKGRLLDVGCAIGILADAASRRGWQAQGLEISPYAAEIARTRYGIPVTCSSLEAAEYPAGIFDAITLIHILEHVSNPVKAMRRILNWLRPGGLVAVEVPNIESRQSRRLGPLWPMLQPEEHLVHYSPRTIRAILEKAGFTSVLEDEAGGTGLLDAMYAGGFRRLHGMILKNIRFLAGARSFVVKAYRLTSGSQTILILAQRPGR